MTKITSYEEEKVSVRLLAVHYTMGGLWVDYNLMTTRPKKRSANPRLRCPYIRGPRCRHAGLLDTLAL
jgi:succinate dehydrogenase/fumarate reductase flavoprotein subunit